MDEMHNTIKHIGKRKITFLKLFVLLLFGGLVVHALRTTYMVLYPEKTWTQFPPKMMARRFTVKSAALMVKSAASTVTVKSAAITVKKTLKTVTKTVRYSMVDHKKKIKHFKLNLIRDDPVILGLEKYIFQTQPWTFPIIKNLPKTNTSIRYARLLDRKLLKQIPDIHTGAKISCEGIVKNNSKDIKAAKSYISVYPKIVTAEDFYLRSTENCQSFIEMRGYITSTMTQSEKDFPIGYSLVLYKDIEMVERLFRMIYRPQNFYCLHIDAKADAKFLKEIESIVKCFDNVFIGSHRVDVKWGTVTIMLADMVCMRDLSKYKWKYYINLTGQEFPLKNNFELVQVLSSLRGINDLESTFKYRNEDRYENVWDINGRPTSLELDPVPLNITVVKGNMHGSLSRGFVDFLINDEKSKIFWDWVKETKMPEESYWATINSNSKLGAPGSYTGSSFESSGLRPYFSREIKWYKDCAGKFVRGVCVNGLGDLKRLVSSPKLFLNKFHLDFEYLALDCFEKWFFDRSKDIYSGKLGFNVRMYKNMPSIKYALRSNNV